MLRAILLVALAGCAVDPITATTSQDLLCGDSCDPGNAQALINVLGYGTSLGGRVVAGTSGCIGGYAQDATCWATFAGADGSRFIVACQGAWGPCDVDDAE